MKFRLTSRFLTGMLRFMLSIIDLARPVIAEAWNLLPAAKTEAVIAKIRLVDLGAVHGTYHPDTGVLDLNPSIFDPGERIDDQGGEHPRRRPYASRAVHTVLHELSHAIGDGTGLDRIPEWLALSGWVLDRDDASGYGRYMEIRPGWSYGPSEWRFKHGSFFPRMYSSKSPQEQFADVCTYRALGWIHVFQSSGRALLDYVDRHVWGRSFAASWFQRRRVA